MNVEELRAKLRAMGVSRDRYSVDGGLPWDATGMESLPDGGWRVYFSERGAKYTVKVFETEAEACDFMLAEVLDEERRRGS